MNIRGYLFTPLRGLLLFATILTASAQQPQLQSPQKDQQPFTLKVSTQLVVETVVVKDKDGKAIEDLTAKDFAVTEDGVPQMISFVERAFMKRRTRSRAPSKASVAAWLRACTPRWMLAWECVSYSSTARSTAIGR